MCHVTKRLFFKGQSNAVNVCEVFSAIFAHVTSFKKCHGFLESTDQTMLCSNIVKLKRKLKKKTYFLSHLSSLPLSPCLLFLSLRVCSCWVCWTCLFQWWPSSGVCWTVFLGKLYLTWSLRWHALPTRRNSRWVHCNPFVAHMQSDMYHGTGATIQYYCNILRYFRHDDISRFFPPS